jgi:hypothetical protein
VFAVSITGVVARQLYSMTAQATCAPECCA